MWRFVYIGTLIAVAASLGTRATLAQISDPRPSVIPLAEIVERARRLYPGELLEAELERRNGRIIYEIDIQAADGSRTELDLDAHDGTLLDSRTEQDEAFRLRSSGEIVSLETIVADAEARFFADFLEAELEEEDGRYEYEIELVTRSGRRIEASFDARTGELLETEND